MTNAIPRPKSTNSKYGLYDMAVYDEKKKNWKDFSLKLYNTIRQSAFYHSQRYHRRYITRQVKNSKNHLVVRVFREY